MISMKSEESKNENIKKQISAIDLKVEKLLLQKKLLELSLTRIEDSVK